REGHDGPKIKNALALSVCRRSGEHTTAVLGWGQAALLNDLVDHFADGASDRWAYKLRAELPTLEALDLGVSEKEVRRLLGRVEAPPPGFVEHVLTLFTNYRKEMRKGKRDWSGANILDGFVTLCQSASFLARGRE